MELENLPPRLGYYVFLFEIPGPVFIGICFLLTHYVFFLFSSSPARSSCLRSMVHPVSSFGIHLRSPVRCFNPSFIFRLSSHSIRLSSFSAVHLYSFPRFIEILAFWFFVSGVPWRKNLGNRACNKRKSIHRKGVVHGFGKAFTLRLYIDLSGNSKVSGKRPLLGLGRHLALALLVRFWLIL